jgi:hypothetical protein
MQPSLHSSTASVISCTAVLRLIQQPHLRLQLTRLLLRCLRLLREPRHFAAAARTLLLKRSAELRALLQDAKQMW